MSGETINPNTGRPVGVAGGIQVGTAADAQREAGGALQELNLTDPVAKLRQHIQQTIQNAKLSDHSRMQAQIKADELIFWVSSGR